MSRDSHISDIGEGSVTLSRDGWQAVMDALEGEEPCRNAAFDALQDLAPEPWLEDMEAREVRS